MTLNPFEILNNISSIHFSLLSEKDWNVLTNLSTHNDYEVRLYLSEILARFHCKQSEEILLRLLNDNDLIVVASACDSASFSNSPEILKKLIDCSKSSNYVVRGYAYLSIGEILSRKYITKYDYSYLYNSLSNETSVWVKASIAYALCLNGYNENVNHIIKLLSNRYYNYRIYSLNLLASLIDLLHLDIGQFEEELLLQNQKENNYIVKCKINSILKKKPD